MSALLPPPVFSDERVRNNSDVASGDIVTDVRKMQKLFALKAETELMYDREYYLTAYLPFDDAYSIVWGKLDFEDNRVKFDYEPNGAIPIIFRKHSYSGHNPSDLTFSGGSSSPGKMSDKSIVWMVVSPTYIQSLPPEQRSNIKGHAKTQGQGDVYLKYDNRDNEMIMEYDTRPPASKHFVLKMSTVGKDARGSNTSSNKNPYGQGVHLVVYLNNVKNEKYRPLQFDAHGSMRTSAVTTSDLVLKVPKYFTWENSRDDLNGNTLPTARQLDSLTSPLFLVLPEVMSTTVDSSSITGVQYNPTTFKPSFNQLTNIDFLLYTWDMNNKYVHYKIGAMIVIFSVIIIAIQSLM